MVSGKHRKRSTFTSPKFLGAALLAYAGAALIVFSQIGGSLPSLPTAPISAVADFSQITAPPHSQPELQNLVETTAIPLSQEKDQDPVLVTATPPKPLPTTTKTTAPTITTTKAPPITPQIAKPPPPAVPTPPISGDGSFRARFYAAAAKYINGGIPYVYGGKSLTSGADCSGFVWKVLQQLDPKQPYRTSYDLDSWTTNISFASAQPGDLLFWPNHVAVYAGNNKVISQGGPTPGPLLVTVWPGYTVGRIPL